jgi:hypothetical protein
MKYIITLFIGILFFTSCKKKDVNFVIKGTVTDNSFNTPLTNVTAYLYKIPAGTSQQELVTSTAPSSSGEYSFSVLRDKTTSFIVRIEKTNYFPIEGTINFSDLTTDHDNVYNFSTTAKSWVNLHFNNSNGIPTDELTFTKQLGKVGCAECCTSGEVTLSGAIDTNIYCINDGNTVYSYLYFVTGTSNSGIRQITTVPFDTVELYLQY